MKKEQLMQIIGEELKATLQEKKRKKPKGKKDACYHKVRARYEKWPSAYGSGALVQCREVGAKNWGKSKVKEQITKKEKSKLTKIKIQLKKAAAKHARQARQAIDIAKTSEKSSKLHTQQVTTIDKMIDEEKEGLRKWFKRRGAKGSKRGWIDCNAPDGKGGYKECAQGDRKRKPACRATPSACDDAGKGKKWGKTKEGVEMDKEQLIQIIREEVKIALQEKKKKKKKKKACKPSKGKRFAKRVDGKCRSFGQAGQAKGGGDRIRPGTKKGDAYCARSLKIKKCKNPPCANTLSRKKWKCRGAKSVAQ